MAKPGSKRKIFFEDEEHEEKRMVLVETALNERPSQINTFPSTSFSLKRSVKSLQKWKKILDTCSESTSTIVNRFRDRVESLPRKDLKLLIEILDGKKEDHFIKSNFTVTRELQSLLFDIAKKSVMTGNHTSVITPAISAFVALKCSFNYLYTGIDEDELFVVFSLLAGVNNIFFSRNTSVDAPSAEITEVDAEGSCSDGEILFSIKEKQQALEQDFEKIKNRWKLLDNVSKSFFNHPAGWNPYLNKPIDIVTFQLKKKLFEKMIKMGLDYAESREYYMSIGLSLDTRNKSSSSSSSSSSSVSQLTPFDASFCLPLINSSNFENVSKLVRSNIIAVFNPVKYPLHHKGRFWGFYAGQCNSKADVDGKTSSSFGVISEYKTRKSTLRKFIMSTLLCKILDVLTTEGESGGAEVAQSVHDQARCFDNLSSNLAPLQCFDIIMHWPLPSNFLMGTYNNLVRSTFEKMSFGKVWLEKKIAWLKNIGWMTERVLSDFGIQNIEPEIFYKAMKIMIFSCCDDSFFKIVTQYGESFSIYSVKEYARYIVSETYSSIAILKTLLKKFPWLLKTWIDRRGDTVLGLCVMHKYPYFKDLLNLDIVREHIDVESMDGLTPLMLAAGYPESVSIIEPLVRDGKANVYFVNRHHESVLHRMAASNNYKGLEIICNYLTPALVELRRKGDGATALMIALSRENVDVADILLSKFGAEAKTKFGNSQSLRTVEAMFLKCKSLSLALLQNFSIVPQPQIIANSIARNLLFEEEIFVAMTGEEDNSKVSENIFKGRVKTMLERRVYGNKRKKLPGAKKNLDHASTCLGELGWKMLNNQRRYGNIKKLLGDPVKDFGNVECPICLEDFRTSNSCAPKGKTLCGHSFHVECWAGLRDPDICPVCRSSTKFVDDRLTKIQPDPVVELPRNIQEDRKFRIKQPNASTLPLCKWESEREVALYEFFINQKWVEESFPLSSSQTCFL